MIIQTPHTLIIGKTYGSKQSETTTDHLSQEHSIRFVVMRVATQQEFVAQCVEYGITSPPVEKKFYEVATD